jgi:hypothetical protein
MPVMERVAKNVRVSVIAFSPTAPDDADARARAEARLLAEGFALDRSGSLGGLARFMTLTQFAGLFGGATAALVLVGIALPGFILAWRVRFAPVFVFLASALWLIAAGVAALAALHALPPLRFH